MADSSRLDKLWQNIRLHLNLQDLTPEQQKQSSLRVAKVLQKVLKDDRVDEDTKERAKTWIKRAAQDPQIQRMFRESSESDIEAFLQLPEEQQLDAVAGVPKSAFTQGITYLKGLQPTLSPESKALIETRFARHHREFAWSDVIWILVILIITGMVMRA